MGMTSEIVAERYGVTRQDQDAAAVSLDLCFDSYLRLKF